MIREARLDRSVDKKLNSPLQDAKLLFSTGRSNALCRISLHLNHNKLRDFSHYSALNQSQISPKQAENQHKISQTG